MRSALPANTRGGLDEDSGGGTCKLVLQQVVSVHQLDVYRTTAVKRQLHQRRQLAAVEAQELLRQLHLLPVSRGGSRCHLSSTSLTSSQNDERRRFLRIPAEQVNMH